MRSSSCSVPKLICIALILTLSTQPAYADWKKTAKVCMLAIGISTALIGTWAVSTTPEQFDSVANLFSDAFGPEMTPKRDFSKPLASQIDEKTLREIYPLVLDSLEVPYFDDVADGCKGRAHKTAWILEENNILSRKIFFIVRTTRSGLPFAPLIHGWRHHAAVVVSVRFSNEGTNEYVIDPTVSPHGPMPIDQYLGIVSNGHEYNQISLEDANTMGDAEFEQANKDVDLLILDAPRFIYDARGIYNVDTKAWLTRDIRKMRRSLERSRNRLNGN